MGVYNKPVRMISYRGSPRKHQTGNKVEGGEDRRPGSGPAVYLPDLRGPLFQNKLELPRDGGGAVAAGITAAPAQAWSTSKCLSPESATM
jgi:hypothetical protein